MAITQTGYSVGVSYAQVAGHHDGGCIQFLIRDYNLGTYVVNKQVRRLPGDYEIAFSYPVLDSAHLFQAVLADRSTGCVTPLSFTALFDAVHLPQQAGELTVTTRCMYTLTILDADKEKAAFKVWKENASTMTLTELLVDVEAYIALVEAVVDGKIVGYSVAIKNAELSGKADPVANSEIERTGLLTFNLENSIYTESVDIPTFSVTLFEGNTINLADEDVAALTDELTGGAYVNQEGQLLDSVKDGVKTFRKHRKQTKRARGAA